MNNEKSKCSWHLNHEKNGKICMIEACNKFRDIPSEKIQENKKNLSLCVCPFSETEEAICKDYMEDK